MQTLRDDPRLERLISQANQVILGKPEAVKLAITCLLAKGHLLIEDLPGMGKTTLAHMLAQMLGLDYQRIQFTSDLLPADVIGVSIYDRTAEQFLFHPGPIFSQLVLADEINRATPKTQSALLEAMEERQITVEGETRSLPEPFFVVATQNPAHQVGTFALPESQLDRFLMRIHLGYPDPVIERHLLQGEGGRNSLALLPPAITLEHLQGWQTEAQQVHVAEPLLDYLQSLLLESRSGSGHGLSPRAGLALLSAAKCWAWMSGRNQVLPEDVQSVWSAVAAHRLGDHAASGISLAQQILQAVAVP
jgi:MoxR-like ATPase